MQSPLSTGDFADTAPASVYHQLLDQGVCVAGVSTMYRILREHDEVRERRRSAGHPHQRMDQPAGRPCRHPVITSDAGDPGSLDKP